MRPLLVAPPVLIALGGALWLSCRSAPAPAPAAPEAPERPLLQGSVSADRAWQHLVALTEIGPRVSGTPGAERARAYIRGQLEALGLEVEDETRSVAWSEEAPELEVHNLSASIPGVSDDLFVLAAPYDTRAFEDFESVGANRASGAALLLELARVISAQPLPYTTRLLFLDAEAPRSATPSGEPQAWLLGSTAAAFDFAEKGLVDRIRLLVLFDSVADADLRIARDLHSHRNYREVFFDAAARLGHGEAFVRTQPFEAVQAGHLSFRRVGLRRITALVDTAYGGDEPPGLYADSAEDDLEHVAPESLGIVGAVAIEGLRTLGARLAKIDRFSDSPLGELEAEAPTTAPQADAAEPMPSPLPQEQPVAPAPDAAPPGSATEDAMAAREPAPGVAPDGESQPPEPDAAEPPRSP